MGRGQRIVPSRARVRPRARGRCPNWPASVRARSRRHGTGARVARPPRFAGTLVDPRVVETCAARPLLIHKLPGLTAARGEQGDKPAITASPPRSPPLARAPERSSCRGQRRSAARQRWRRTDARTRRPTRARASPESRCARQALSVRPLPVSSTALRSGSTRLSAQTCRRARHARFVLFPHGRGRPVVSGVRSRLIRHERRQEAREPSHRPE
jgi:hypothetical protein